MAEDVATRNEPRAGAERWSTRTRRFLFGDDVFISYSRRDAADYALALASELTRRELSCFLDQWGTPPGSKLPEPLKAALRGSGMLVLVGTSGAAASENVREEVEAFLETGRTIIPITFSNRGTGTAEDARESLQGTLEQSSWYDLIRGTSVTVESLEALATVAPSALVIDRIANARGFTRRNKRLRQVFWTTLSAVGVLLVAGLAGSEILLQRAADARKQADDADRKRAAAVLEREKAEAATAAAETRGRRITSERLAALSESHLEDRPQLALTLAVEAVNVHREANDPPVFAAEQSLRRALVGVGGDPLAGHPRAVVGIVSSADGRLYTNGCEDRIRAWAFAGGRPAPAAPLQGEPSSMFLGCDLSPDGRWLIAYDSYRPTAKLWDLSRPGSPRRFDLDFDERLEGFSPNSRRLLTMDRDFSAASYRDLGIEGPSRRSTLFGSATALIPAPKAKASPMEATYGLRTHLGWSKDHRWLVASRNGSESMLFDTTRDDPTSTPTSLGGLASEVSVVAVAADGRRVGLVVGPDGRSIGVWTRHGDGTVAGPPRVIETPSRVEAMAMSADGRWLAAGSGQPASLWDLSGPATGPVPLTGHAGVVKTIAFSPDGRWLATGGEDAIDLGRDPKAKNVAQLWDLESSPPAGRPLPLSSNRGRLRGNANWLGFSLDGRWLAARTTGSPNVRSDFEGAAVHLWRVADERLDPLTHIPIAFERGIALRGHEGLIGQVHFTRDGQWLATAGFDGTARAWGLLAEPQAAAPISLGADGYEPKILVRGRWLVAVGQSVRLWDLGSVPERGGGLVVTNYRGRPPLAAIDRQGNWLAVASADAEGKLRELRLLDLASPRPADRPTTLEGHAAPVDRIAIGDNGRRMVTTGTDGAVLAWDLSARPPKAITLAGPKIPIGALDLSRDGRLLATAATGAGPVQVYNLDTARSTGASVALDDLGDEVAQLVFSPDGRWVASRGRGGKGRLWPMAGQSAGPTRKPIALDRPGGLVVALEVGADGRWLASQESPDSSPGLAYQTDYRLRLWDLAADDPSAAQPVAWPFPAPREPDFGFSPDGRFLLSHLTPTEVMKVRSRDNSFLDPINPSDAIALRDLAGDDPGNAAPRVLEVAFGPKAAFSPDGRWFLSENKLVDLTARPGSPPMMLPTLGRSGAYMAHATAFSTDGRWAILGVGDGIELHPVALDDLLDLARRAAGRNLFPQEWKDDMPADRTYRKTFPDLP